MNANVGERHSFTGTLDYRFRWYDDSDRRNDSDLRWNFNLSRPVDDDNLRFGMRGRASYRGDSQYRNDWGVFADYRLGFGDSDQVTIGGEVRERRYPQGPERDRTRDIAQLTASWTHSLPNGRTSFTLGGQLTQEWATQERPDGNASFWGVNGEVDHSFGDTLDGLFWWSYDNESYDDERPDFTTDPDLLLTRNDDLWHFGASLVWGFARGWSLRPTIEYNWEDSNIDALAYSSTEYWLDGPQVILGRNRAHRGASGAAGSRVTRSTSCMSLLDSLTTRVLIGRIVSIRHALRLSAPPRLWINTLSSPAATRSLRVVRPIDDATAISGH